MLASTLSIEVPREDQFEDIHGFGRKCWGVGRRPDLDPEVVPKRVRVIKCGDDHKGAK